MSHGYLTQGHIIIAILPRFGHLFPSEAQAYKYLGFNEDPLPDTVIKIAENMCAKPFFPTVCALTIKLILVTDVQMPVLVRMPSITTSPPPSLSSTSKLVTWIPSKAAGLLRPAGHPAPVGQGRRPRHLLFSGVIMRLNAKVGNISFPPPAV